MGAGKGHSEWGPQMFVAVLVGEQDTHTHAHTHISDKARLPKGTTQQAEISVAKANSLRAQGMWQGDPQVP